MTRCIALLLCAIAINLSAQTATSSVQNTFLGIVGQPPADSPCALVAGESATLRILPSDTKRIAEGIPRLFQIAGTIARPLDTHIAVEADPSDSRVILVRFTPPSVTHPARFRLRLGDANAFTFSVFPADPRLDLASLTDALATSGLRLLVCGKSGELRAWLRMQKLNFDDEGVDPPASVPADTLLLGVLNEEDWRRLIAYPAEGCRILAFVDAPNLLPGVYAEPASRRAKITLPLLSRLSTDPLARQTLHTLLFNALSTSE